MAEMRFQNFDGVKPRRLRQAAGRFQSPRLVAAVRAWLELAAAAKGYGACWCGYLMFALAEHPPVRVLGTAVFMTANLNAVPHAMLHSLKDAYGVE